MTEKYRFFNSGAGDTRQYSSAELSEVFRRFLGNGALPGVLNELAVTAGAGVQVLVNTGEAMVQGYWYQNDASKAINLTAPDATNARIDRIVVRLDLNALVRTVSVVKKDGVPAGSPTPPALQQDGTIYEVSLAQVRVAAGAGALTITDERSWAMPGGGMTSYQDFREIADVSNPPAGFMRVYIDSDDHKAYSRSSAGVVSALGDTPELITSGTTPNGAATAFLIGAGVNSKKVWVFVNGLIREKDTDYTFTPGENHIDMLWTPQTGDKVQMIYVPS